MLKKLIYFIGFSAMFGATAQNVGIGNSSPNEKLDVTGNINLTGTIKTNGVDGTAGQVLMKNNSGAFSWGDVSQYKNVVGFKAGSSVLSNTNYTWTVPAGITQIFVECWGGGGGGASGGGGGGGGYAAVQWDVSPGDMADIVIGSGGEGAASVSTSGARGNNTVVRIKLDQLFAEGGSGGNINAGGFPGRFSSNTALYVYGQSGTAGEANSENYGPFNPTTYYTAIKYGSGGTGGNTFYTQKNGAFHAYNNSTLATLKRYFGQIGAEPGGGGGGSDSFPYYGGPGLVVIHY